MLWLEIKKGVSCIEKGTNLINGIKRFSYLKSFYANKIRKEENTMLKFRVIKVNVHAGNNACGGGSNACGGGGMSVK